MQYQGYSTKNLHQGDVKITGDLEVCGDTKIKGNLDVDGIITGSIGTARIWQNLFTMKNYNPNQSLVGAYQNFDLDGYGSKVLNNIDEEFKIGGIIKVNITGQYQVSRSGTTTNRVGIRFGFLQNYDVFTPIVLQNTTFTGVDVVFGYFNIECVYTRISATEVLLSGLVVSFYKGATAGDLNQGNSDTPNVFSFQNPAITLPITITGFVAGGTYAISTSYVDLSTINGQIKMRASKYTIDICNPDSTILTSSAAPTTDHTSLANLTAGDAGHTQFALLSGRTGGQVLSGGTTNLHDLKLKSHTAGLDNVVIKDLNTEFKKNIDMDNNNIINANEIIKTTPSGADLRVENNDGPLVLSAQGLTSNIQLATTNNVSVNSNLFESLASVNLFNANIVMNGNQIQNTTLVSSNTALECLATADLRLVGDTVDMAATNAITHAIGAVPKLTIDGAETTTFADFNMASNDLKDALNIIDASTQNKINMNDAGFLNAINITSNGNGVNLQETSTGNRISISSSGLASQVVSGITNIQNTDAGNNLTLSKTNGGNIFLQNTGTGGNVELEAEGIDINYTTNTFKVRNDLNTSFVIDGTDTESFLNFKCPSINSLTPVGGLSSGTSNSAILTASTAEQSILANTFVGGRQAGANTFKQGDAYTATLAGNFSSNNGDTLTLRLKGGATGTTILSSIVVPLNGSSGVFFELEINFVVRQIGAAGLADVAVNYDFSYNQSSGGNFQGERKCEFNNTTFDTTILNQLDITAQFSSTNAGNSIETILSTLGKTY